MREYLIKQLNTQNNLPPFPEVLIKLQSLLNDPDSTIRDVSKLIEMDPTLAGRVLQLVNSAYYGTIQRIDSMNTAVSKLGFERIKQLVFSIVLTRLFDDNRVINYFNFWKHSFAVALVTQSICRFTTIPQKICYSSYLSGLMHDLGIIVFAYLIPDEYADFIQISNNKEEPINELEQRYFGIDHQEIGALFVDKWWHIDPEISHAIRHHHSPFSGSLHQRQCSQVVNVANGICNSQGYSHGITSYMEFFKEGAWDSLGLTISIVDDMLADVQRCISHALEILGYFDIVRQK